MDAELTEHIAHDRVGGRRLTRRRRARSGVRAWQQRPAENVYPIVFLDALVMGADRRVVHPIRHKPGTCPLARRVGVVDEPVDHRGGDRVIAEDLAS
jgi:hypothetical protein